jgi:hypothetical protein
LLDVEVTLNVFLKRVNRFGSRLVLLRLWHSTHYTGSGLWLLLPLYGVFFAGVYCTCCTLLHSAVELLFDTWVHICLLQLSEIETLKAGLKALEEQNQDTVPSILARIKNLALTPPHDFDKYEALALAQDLVRVSNTTHHAPREGDPLFCESPGNTSKT